MIIVYYLKVVLSSKIGKVTLSQMPSSADSNPTKGVVTPPEADADV